MQTPLHSVKPGLPVRSHWAQLIGSQAGLELRAFCNLLRLPVLWQAKAEWLAKCCTSADFGAHDYSPSAVTYLWLPSFFSFLQALAASCSSSAALRCNLRHVLPSSLFKCKSKQSNDPWNCQQGFQELPGPSPQVCFSLAVPRLLTPFAAHQSYSRNSKLKSKLH